MLEPPISLKFCALLVSSSWVIFGTDYFQINAAYGAVTECRAETLDSDRFIKCVNSQREYVERETLKPVIATLRYFAESDTKLSTLLSKVQIRAVKPWTRNHSVNAVAPRLNSFTCLEPQINIDLGFVHELLAMSELVAVDRAGVPNAAEIGKAYVSSYKRDVTKAMAEGVPFFWPRFDVKAYAHDWPFEVVQDLSLDSMYELMAWTILHEVAHHYLGHTQSSICSVESSDITSLRERRDAERDADLWAFQKLKTLGYQGNALSTFFSLQKTNEFIRRNLGAEKPEDQSDHPSWETRARLLSENFQVEENPPFPYRLFSGYLFLDPKNHQLVQKIELLFLRSFDDGIYIGMLFSKLPRAAQESIPVIVEHSNQHVVLHARFENIRMEYVVLEPDKLMTNIELKSYQVGNEIPLSTVSLSGWSRGYTSINHTTKASGSLAMFMRSSPFKINLRIFQEIDPRPHIVARAMDIVRKMMVVDRDLALGYVKGYKTLDEIMAAGIRNKELFQSNLRTLLGEPKFREYQKAVLQFAAPLLQETLGLLEQKPEWLNELSNKIDQEFDAVR